MFERYHIPLRPTPGRATPVPKYVIVRADNCVNCGKCEKSCIYGVYKRSEQDPRKMADPINSLCKNCFRCIEDCPQRALIMAPGPDYRALGRGVWTPQRITTIWGESETGKIPVLGAGYRGMFAGPGYDGMWTDMSEIVRPTRDGIHGREFISTSVDIGRKPDVLEFGKQGQLLTRMPSMIELPVPFVLDSTRLRQDSDQLMIGFARAAALLDTQLFAHPESIPKEASEVLNSHLVPVYPKGTDLESVDLPPGARMAEISYSPSWKDDLRRFRGRFPNTVLSFRMGASEGIEQRVIELVRGKAEVAHILFDEDSLEEGTSEPRHSKDTLRAVHRAMVSKSLRDQITIISGGGLAAAEHVPKSIICGADVVSLEKALVIALECRDCITCSRGSCPINLDDARPEWVESRVTNLAGAWRDQLLEVLGAMGLREVRRLRGEVGRAIFFEDVESESFASI
ncbi:MAG TPA: glutamate synthase-related protein, partial [Thermoplasmata archaeon]